ncbi:MAG: cupin domain-containing protein [Spirochaetales bacterium]|nr:cupin domain-containing protein [Spirochaetales bacterium]
MRDGCGKVEIVHVFKKEELKGKARLFARIILHKNCSIGFHTHENEEEIYYILSGIATVNDNGTTYEAKAGDAILTGNGAGHSIENQQDSPLQVLAVILLYS